MRFRRKPIEVEVVVSERWGLATVQQGVTAMASTKKRGTSSAPIVLGIIGGMVGFPSAILGGGCAACVETIGTKGSAPEGSLTVTILLLGLIGSVLGFFSGVLSKTSPVGAGVGMILAAVVAGITAFLGNVLAFLVAMLFLIGGFVSIFQKKEEMHPEGTPK
jgi:VIT1/CCC1 family predicted Fe2+/Mn2+ transporter